MVVVSGSELDLKVYYTNSCILLSVTADVSWNKRKARRKCV